MANAEIRRAGVADAPGIAAISVRGWQWAYRGLVPDAILDSLSIEQRTAGWRRYLASQSALGRTWLAERDGRVVGFADTGPSRDEDAATGIGEVYAIYVDPAEAGTGLGRALFGHAVAELARQRYQAATLWVLAGNRRARRFYEAAGWRPDGTARVEPREGYDLHEVRYRGELTGVSQILAGASED
jgi:GNAT superfamily N-acetyltransferase